MMNTARQKQFHHLTQSNLSSTAKPWRVLPFAHASGRPSWIYQWILRTWWEWSHGLQHGQLFHGLFEKCCFPFQLVNCSSPPRGSCGILLKIHSSGETCKQTHHVYECTLNFGLLKCLSNTNIKICVTHEVVTSWNLVSFFSFFL